jgi:hypothetical protein
MSDTRSQQDMGGIVSALGPATGLPVGKRPGLRIALLALAAVILLLGVAAVGIFAYRTINP